MPPQKSRMFDDELYPRWQALLFRVTLVLLLVGFAGIVGRNWIADVEFRRSLGTLHRSAGLAVLLITLLRISTASILRFPPKSGARAVRIFGVILQALLCAALIATPLLGWALASARGQAVLFLGAIPLPPLGPPADAGWVDPLMQWHWLATAVLIGLIVTFASVRIARLLRLRLYRSDLRAESLLPPRHEVDLP